MPDANGRRRGTGSPEPHGGQAAGQSASLTRWRLPDNGFHAGGVLKRKPHGSVATTGRGSPAGSSTTARVSTATGAPFANVSFTTQPVHSGGSTG